MTPRTMPPDHPVQVECVPGATTWRYRDYPGTQVTVFNLQRPHQQMRRTASSLVENTDRARVAATATREQLRAPSTVDGPAEIPARPTSLTTVDSRFADQASALPGVVPVRARPTPSRGRARSNVDYVPSSTGVRTAAQEARSMGKG